MKRIISLPSYIVCLGILLHSLITPVAVYAEAASEKAGSNSLSTGDDTDGNKKDTDSDNKSAPRPHKPRLDFAREGILYYEQCVGGGESPGSSSSSSDPLPATVPEPWRSLINNAAEKHPTVDRRLVAAVLWAENRGWPKYADSNSVTSHAAAVGFWQFIPSTWAALGVDGDGDGKKDPRNPKDAVHAAFRHHEGSAGLPIIDGATGNIDQDFETKPFQRNRKNLMSFAASYNGSGATDGIPIAKFRKGDENSDYVRMVYWLIATDFKKGYLPAGDKFVDATKQGAGADGSAASDIGVSNRSAAGACVNGSGSAGSHVNAEGYAFPVGLPKDDVSPSGKSFPCERNDFCGHHDNTPAFDLSDKEWGVSSSVGVPVFAIYSGKISQVSNRRGYSHCIDITLQGDDGHSYWYGHTTKSSVQTGQNVSAGEKISEIGPTECADNTPSHLHIDRGKPKGQNAGLVCCRDPEFVPLMNKLWEGLP